MKTREEQDERRAKLDALKQMEVSGSTVGTEYSDAEIAGNSGNPEDSNIESSEEVKSHTMGIRYSEENRPNVINGNFIIERDQLPHHGLYYPENWNFAYRCPKAEEVAIFSTFDPRDQVGIMIAIADLIRKTVVIYDDENDMVIPTGEICDAHQPFFMLKIREAYLSNAPIMIDVMCQNDLEQYQAPFTADKFKYKIPNEKLLSIYDGRVFRFKFSDIDDAIEIRIPTLATSSKIYKYLTKVYRSAQQGGTKDKALEKYNKIFYDKLFLLVAPFLFVTGSETIGDIVKRFKEISSNELVYKHYLEIINSFKLDNYSTFDVECPKCGGLDEAEIRFPEWRYMFIKPMDNTESTEGYFD